MTYQEPQSQTTSPQLAKLLTVSIQGWKTTAHMNIKLMTCYDYTCKPKAVFLHLKTHDYAYICTFKATVHRANKTFFKSEILNEYAVPE